MLERALFDLESEQAVLGSILLDAACIRRVARVVREEDFSTELNRELFRTALAMEQTGQSVDPLTLAAELNRRNAGEPQTVRGYLAQLLEITPTAANALEYAQIVQETGRRRRLREAFQAAAEALGSGESEESVTPLVEKAMSEAADRSKSELLSPLEQVDAFYRHRELIDSGQSVSVRTGFRSLDRLLPGGLVKGGLYFLGARPAVGKTALALFISEYVASTAGAVTFVSMEMSPEQLLARRISSLGRVDSKLILSETLTEADYRKVADAALTVGKTPVYVTAGRALPVRRIASVARSRKDTKLVVIDHFSLIPMPGKQTSHTEYAEASHALKRLAQSMNVPVLCLAQLNRENEQRTDKRPRLSDLRATGAAEEDADGVLLLHRPDYYDDRERGEAAPVMMEVNLAKNRYGETGRVNLSFWAKTNTFRESFVK